MLSIVAASLWSSFWLVHDTLWWVGKMSYPWLLHISIILLFGWFIAWHVIGNIAGSKFAFFLVTLWLSGTCYLGCHKLLHHCHHWYLSQYGSTYSIRLGNDGVMLLVLLAWSTCTVTRQFLRAWIFFVPAIINSDCRFCSSFCSFIFWGPYLLHRTVSSWIDQYDCVGSPRWSVVSFNSNFDFVDVVFPNLDMLCLDPGVSQMLKWLGVWFHHQ